MLHQYFLDGEKGWSEWIFGALLNCNIALGYSGDGIAMQQVNKIFLENKEEEIEMMRHTAVSTSSTDLRTVAFCISEVIHKDVLILVMIDDVVYLTSLTKRMHRPSTV